MCGRDQRQEAVALAGRRSEWLLDVLVQSRRNAKAAKRLIRKLLKAQGRAPRVMITDKLRSYDRAKRDIMPGID